MHREPCHPSLRSAADPRHDLGPPLARLAVAVALGVCALRALEWVMVAIAEGRVW